MNKTDKKKGTIAGKAVEEKALKKGGAEEKAAGNGLKKNLQAAKKK